MTEIWAVQHPQHPRAYRDTKTEGTHCQSSTGITWTDTQAAESWTGDDA